MKNIAIIVIIALAISILSYSSQPTSRPGTTPAPAAQSNKPLKPDTISITAIKAVNISELEIPVVVSGDFVIRHTGYSFVYSEPFEQSKWVAYELTKSETNKITDRTDKFVPDPEVASGTADNKDYAKSGYDRGHLAPAADMGWSLTSMQESFYFSNMSPQRPAFNRGIWKMLEEQVRTWAIENDALYIVTGPVLKTGLPFIGPNEVAIPQYYYKVILDYTNPDVKAIGFLFPNAGSDDSLQRFAVSIDSVEKFTGLDFYSKLPDNQEKVIEKTLCITCWTWQ